MPPTEDYRINVFDFTVCPHKFPEAGEAGFPLQGKIVVRGSAIGLSDKDDQAAIDYDHGNRAVGIAPQGGT